mmetsp:Transcript_27207/g.27718  ORF Transcript_27207/g.27718 Transcript_27207/m.27718 type:complete len:128 (-) Transcript_27207:262-645(-)
MLSFLPGLYKHVGINVRFDANNYVIIHPEGLGFCSSITNALNNSLAKVIWFLVNILTCKSVNLYHGRELCILRLDKHKEELENKYIDALYTESKYVGKKFVKRYNGYKELKDELDFSELVDDKTKND